MVKLKGMRGMCAAVLTFFVLLSAMCNAAAAVKTGESDEEKMLNFGIIREPLPLDEQVTVAQYSAMLVRALGLDEAASSYTQGDWAEGYLTLGENLRFYSALPEGIQLRGTATVENAVVMTVAALGYDVTAPQNSSEQYLVGAKLGLYDRISASKQDTLIRSDAYAMICKALEIDLCIVEKYGDMRDDTYFVDRGNTMMSNLLELHERTYATGVVEASYNISLTGASVKEGEVVIDGDRYFVGSSNAESYVGCYVGFYADFENGTDYGTIQWIAPHRKNEIVLLDETVSKSLNGLQLSYMPEDGKKEETLRLSETYLTVLNNQVVESGAADVDLEHNRVKLVDNDNDGDYDIVFITAIQSFVIDSIDAELGMVWFENGMLRENKGIRLTLDDKDYRYEYFDKNGDAVRLSDIEKGDAVSIMASSDLKRISIYVLDEPFVGKVTEYSDAELKIVVDEEEYDLVSGTEGIVPGASGNFYADLWGRIFYVSDSVESYVYVSGVDEGRKGSLGMPKLKVFTRDDGFQTYTLSGRVTINGERYKDTEEMKAKLRAGTVATVKVNAEGEVHKLDYADVYAERGTRTFCEHDFGFNDYSDKVLTPFACEQKNTAVFFVPVSGDDDEYFNTFPLYDDEDYCVTGYDYDERQGTVRAVVIEMDTQQPISAGFDSSSKVMAVNGVRKIYRNDTTTYEISGICGGEEVTFPAAQTQSVFNVLSTVDKGDVIQFVLNWDNEIGLVRKAMDYSVLSDSYYDTSDYRNTQIYAPVSQVNDSVMTNFRKYLVHEILCDVSGHGTITSVVSASESAVANTDDKGFNNYFVYDAKRKEYKPGSIDSIIPGGSGAWEPSKVFIQTQSDTGTVKFVVVFN